MQPCLNKIDSKRFRIGLMTLLLVLILSYPAAWAVESGMLSITAEGVTAARAIFAQHPDPKVRNDDYLAMKTGRPGILALLTDETGLQNGCIGHQNVSL